MWTPEALQAEQLRLEREMHTGGINRFRRAQERNLEVTPSETAWNRNLTSNFVNPLAEAIDAFVSHERSKGFSRVAAAVPIFECIPSDVAALIAIKVLLGVVTQDVSFTAVTLKIGGAIEDNIRFTKLSEAAPHYIAKVQESLKKARSRSYSHQRNVYSHVESTLVDRAKDPNNEYAIDIDAWVRWDEATKDKVGATLTHLALQVLEYKGEPVFTKEIVSRAKGYRIGLSPVTLGWIDEYKAFMETMSPEFGPCVVPPKDWTSPIGGGYFTPELNRTLPLVKTDSRQHLARYTEDKIPKIYKGINYLQSIPWEINKAVLTVLTEIQEAGTGLGIPSKEPAPRPINPVREELSHLKGQELQAELSEVEKEMFERWKVDMREYYTNEDKRVGNYLSFARTYTSAMQYQRYDKLYFVHTLDRRGRVYTRSSTVDPQGGDVQKALIQFGEGKELGETGRYWLAVQGAMTLDIKGSFDARVKAIEELEETIRDIATAPTVFTSWVEADSPFCYLAFCLEWNALLEWEDSGNPASSFVSKLPVAQDGSCSGIQHYSGMLRDSVGGKAVNLIDGTEPEDIYDEVAEVLIGKLQKPKDLPDLMFKGQPISSSRIAELAEQWLEVGIDRDLTKLSVMILPYGGTLVSSRESIKSHLEKIQDRENNQAYLQGREANAAHPFRGLGADRELPVIFLANALWASIGEVVQSAREGMEAIQRIAYALAKDNLDIRWTTPLGFKVSREKFKREEKRVRTFMMGEMICRNVLQVDTDTLDPYKQRSGSAPDFVHSYDASHVHLVALGAMEAGLTLSCTHDSFSTHACNVPEMRKLLNEGFVELYKDKDPIKELLLESELRLGKEILDNSPQQGSLVIEDVLKSTYLFG